MIFHISGLCKVLSPLNCQLPHHCTASQVFSRPQRGSCSEQRGPLGALKAESNTSVLIRLQKIPMLEKTDGSKVMTEVTEEELKQERKMSSSATHYASNKPLIDILELPGANSCYRSGPGPRVSLDTAISAFIAAIDSSMYYHFRFLFHRKLLRTHRFISEC